MRHRYPNVPGQVGRITSAIGDAAGLIGATDVTSVDSNLIARELTVNAVDVEHGK